jgi:hypothetical protein
MCNILPESNLHNSPAQIVLKTELLACLHKLNPRVRSLHNACWFLVVSALRYALLLALVAHQGHEPHAHLFPIIK